jgi:hypothetical protein
MIPGFEKIVEARIKKAQIQGEFDKLPGKGKPLELNNDQHVPEDMRLAFKILKNANFLPPEIEMKKEIKNTQDLLAGMKDESEKYRTLKKLNFLIMKLNIARNSSIDFEMPQQYHEKLVESMEMKISNS